MNYMALKNVFLKNCMQATLQRNFIDCLNTENNKFQFDEAIIEATHWSAQENGK